MNEIASRAMLEAIQAGLEENSLLIAIGYDATQGRPGRYLLNNLLKRNGYDAIIPDTGNDLLRAHQPYPPEWIKLIVKAITGDPDTPIHDTIELHRKKAALPV